MLLRNDEGAVFAEYVTIMVLVSLGCAAAIVALGVPFYNLFLFQQAEPAPEIVVLGSSRSFYVEPEYYYGLECFAETFDGGFAHDCIAVLPERG